MPRWRVLTVQTSTSTLDIVRQLLSLSQKQELVYGIAGVLHSKDGRLPFDNSGVLLEKGQLLVSSSP